MFLNMPANTPSVLDIVQGTILGNSYKVEAVLREGSFGFVTKCLNTQTNKAVAIKVNRNDPEILEQANLEMFILEQLRCLDPDRCNIVKWNGFFYDRERLCLNFELLDQSLDEYMKDRDNQGLPISELRPVLYQLANALSHLSSLGIVHTDLRTDNLMVVDRHQSPLKVKIIDFGLACPVSALFPGECVQTIWHRAPEVIVCAPFNQAIDMWSLGVIAVELAIGLPLYPGETEFDVLRFIICTQGQPPDSVLDRGFDTEFFFIQKYCGNRRWSFKSEEEFQSDTEYKMQETRFFKLKSLDDLEQLMKKTTGHHSGQDLFVSLIKQMLHLDASQRITPLEALRHPFFCDPGLSQNSFRDTCIDIENKEDKRLILPQQPSYCQSKSPHSIDCSVRNPVELSEQALIKMSANKPSVFPDELDIVQGAILGNTYKVEASLGEGSFGFVTKCLNIQTNTAVAIKVNKNDPKILEQANLEMFILEQLRCLDPDRCNIVKWNGFFHDRERLCLNFELLDQSLDDYMKDRDNQGLPLSELRPVLYQLVNALSHLSSMGIVHTDLKTDNLMVVDRHQSPLKVKIIDFGLACPVSALVPGDCVQTLWHRAPEVIICAPFNQAIDMWSLGVIAVELATGLPLYPGETEFDVLRFIIHTQGQPPDCVLDRGFDTEFFFIQKYCGNRRWRFKSEEEFQSDTEYKMQETRFFKLKSLDDLEQLMKKTTGHHSSQDLLVSLIKQMLHLDASQRITPLEALRHPFFCDPGLSQNSSRDTCIDIENKEDKRLVPPQQPSYCQSKSPHSIDCSVQNAVELSEQTPLNMSANKPSVVPDELDIVQGTILGNSYKVEASLREGSFGFITKCLNIQTNKAVAIKVNKNNPKILEQANLEMFILEQLRCLDPDRCNIVKWNGFFHDRERLCLNFELLDQSLHDYMKDRNNQGLPLSELRPVLYQLVNALSHLSAMGIVHTNLKTDNLMVVDRHQSPLKVKIIDFGLARLVSALFPGDCVQTLWHRAPEVIICAPFNQAIDMWSLGVIAVELATGLPLYPGETEFDVLRFIICTQGQPPDCVLDRGFDTEVFFIQKYCGNQRWRLKSEEEFQSDTGYKMQETRFFKLKSLDDLEQLMKKTTGHHSGQDLFVSLIKQMLHLDASQRITPLEALRHPFFDL